MGPHCQVGKCSQNDRDLSSDFQFLGDSKNSLGKAYNLLLMKQLMTLLRKCQRTLNLESSV